MGRLAEQRRRAAALGAEVRSRRAAVKRRIAGGDLGLEEVLRGELDNDPDVAVAEEIATGQLVRSVRGIGPAIATEILADLQINPDKPMGELDAAERRALADEIERT